MIHLVFFSWEIYNKNDLEDNFGPLFIRLQMLQPFINDSCPATTVLFH